MLSAVEVTRLLNAWSGGDESALERLTPLVYSELHRLARRYMAGERPDHVLQTLALINEACLRLIGSPPVDWESRSHFFAVSARIMRQILVDFARTQGTRKRGERAPHFDLDGVWDLAAPNQPDFHDLDRALNRLAELNSRQAQVVELRFFGGLENAEIASVLSVSEPTIVRDWRLARAFLYDALTNGR